MIYLDNSATTRLDDCAAKIFQKYCLDEFFNPSAIYATKNAQDIVLAKKVICNKLGGEYNNNFIFTASASEANNLAFSVASNNFVVSQGEHPSVYNKALELKNAGKNVTFVPLDKDGKVDLDALKNCLNADTKFISVMHVSNETGAINDLKAICAIKDKICSNAIFHSDGVQAFCKIDDRPLRYVDIYTISAHKIGGPKGIGGIYCKNINKLKPIIFGGGQEFGLRSGTENTPAIMAFAEVVSKRKTDLQYVQNLKNKFLEFLDKNIEQNIDNNQNVSPYILSLRTPFVNGETMVNALAQQGVLISTGSACSSKKAGNRILQAMGKDMQQIKQSIRISFFETNTLQQIQQAADIFNNTYNMLCQKLKK